MNQYFLTLAPTEGSSSPIKAQSQGFAPPVLSGLGHYRAPRPNMLHASGSGRGNVYLNHGQAMNHHPGLQHAAPSFAKAIQGPMNRISNPLFRPIWPNEPCKYSNSLEFHGQGWEYEHMFPPGSKPNTYKQKDQYQRASTSMHEENSNGEVPKINQGIDVHPGSVDVTEVVDVAGPSTRITAASALTPHICSAKSAKQAWDILAGLYAGRNEAKIALLRKELESKNMNEEYDMDTFLAGIKDINEQLIFAGEIISNSFLVRTVLDALPDSYQTFGSTWQLMNQRNPEVVKFDEVCTLLLQEALSKKHRSRQR
ncbi:hypothetical protein L7F22_051556 [Adiantum nelumboides]|nr:hypothetical protein [Adiantum nelumboides]